MCHVRATEAGPHEVSYSDLAPIDSDGPSPRIGQPNSEIAVSIPHLNCRFADNLGSGSFAQRYGVRGNPSGRSRAPVVQFAHKTATHNTQTY